MLIKSKGVKMHVDVTFDGFGINDANDPYKRRLATLTQSGQELGIGPIIERAITSHDELLAILKKMHKHFITEAEHIGEIEEVLERESMNAITKAEGK